MEIAHPVQSPPHSSIIYSIIIIEYIIKLINIIVICVRYHNRNVKNYHFSCTCVEGDAYDTHCTNDQRGKRQRESERACANESGQIGKAS